MPELSYPTRTQPRVLLVVEDAATQLSVARTLRRRGYDVALARTIAAAREPLERLDVDVVIADLALSDGSGHDVLAAALSRDPDLPVLFLGHPAGADAPGRCLAKPVDEADLLDALASVRPSDDDVDSAAAFHDAAGAMYLALQPVVSWSRQEVVACEILLRSRHRALGRPERLLAAAAHHGRIHELGRAVRARIADCIDELPAGGDVFVNVHAAELEDDELLSSSSPLARHAHRVVLDVSAQAHLDRVGVAARLVPLRALGYRIALDDLADTGTGLGLLAVLAPDVLKIDGSLIHGLRRDALRRTLVRGLFALGARLGAETIAEGVETEDDLAGVVAAGGDRVSGFLFGRPSPRLPVIDLGALRHRIVLR